KLLAIWTELLGLRKIHRRRPAPFGLAVQLDLHAKKPNALGDSAALKNKNPLTKSLGRPRLLADGLNKLLLALLGRGGSSKFLFNDSHDQCSVSLGGFGSLPSAIVSLLRMGSLPRPFTASSPPPP